MIIHDADRLFPIADYDIDVGDKIYCRQVRDVADCFDCFCRQYAIPKCQPR